MVAVANATDREVRISDLPPNAKYEFGIRAYTAINAGAMTRVPIGISGPYAIFGAPNVPYDVVRGPWAIEV